MEQKELQIMFSEEIYGDILLQLKDGKIIFYYFRGEGNIYIYNEKSFQKLFEINLYKDSMNSQNENSHKSIERENKIENTLTNIYDYLFAPKKKYRNKSIKNSIKELDNGFILIGSGINLYELNLKEKSYDLKIVKQFKNNILDINEFSEKRIIVITDKNIIILNNTEKEYIIQNQYLIHDNWKITPLSSKSRFHGDFHQYYYSYVLPNNRLLLNSFSTEEGRFSKCGTHPPKEYSQSKFILIGLNNFNEIKSTEDFKTHARYIVLENRIIIQTNNNFIIYDIDSLEIIKNIKFNNFYDYIYKYDEQYLILLSEEEKDNNLYFFKIQDNDSIKFFKFKVSLQFHQYIYHSYPILEYNNKFMLTLKDKRIIILCHDKIYILKLIPD